MNTGNPLEMGFLVSKFLMDYDNKTKILMKLGINYILESYILEVRLLSLKKSMGSALSSKQERRMASRTQKKQRTTMVSSFLEITNGQTEETAMKFLNASNWNLDEAILLFNNNNNNNIDEDEYEVEVDIEDKVRPPLPVVKDTLCYYPQHYQQNNPEIWESEEHSNNKNKNPEVWESEKRTDDKNNNNNLASLYRPPVALMFNGSFEKAKDVASDENKWLLVNLQSTKEFISHRLNRDTWADEAVSQTIRANNFIFWQVYDDDGDDDISECRKVCGYYKLDSLPVVLVIDPVTGEKMRKWSGMVDPVSLLEDLLSFMDSGPRDQLERASKMQLPAHPPVHEQLPAYPAVPEEPLQVARNLVCRIGVRLPDGRMIRRNFLLTDPVQLLWPFCFSQLEEADQMRRFLLTQPAPGASKSLDYNSKMTFQESGLNNSVILVTWE